MASLNDLINVQFVDAVTHDIVDTSDVLGVIMPYHWGPAGKVNVFDSQSFYEAYPEFKRSDVVLTNVKVTYAQIKSYFVNGGSKVAVYRPFIAAELFAEDDGDEAAAVKPIVADGDLYLALKYPGLPPFEGALKLVSAQVTGSNNYSVSLTDGVASPNTKVYETFIGQITDPTAVDEDGETTYLPTILKNKSAYMQIVDITEEGVTAPTAIIPETYTPTAGTVTLANAFATGDTIEGGATQFIEYDANVDAYQSATFFIPIAGESWSSSNNKFVLDIEGTEKIKCFGTYCTINCNAGVAGAYAKVAQNNNLNQVASARTYGAYIGNITSSKSFANVLTDANIGKITVFNAPSGPQIFGVRNSYARTKPGSYFSKANVTRVLAALLRNIKPLCLDAIHTQTAADAILRSQFETRLNNVMNTFIGNRDLQPDSIAICNASNNSDAQTLGGQILNVILKCHFIGLVEMVNIKVVATDSSVTTEIV